MKHNCMSFTRPFLLGPAFFWTALSSSSGFHQERSWMPLHEAVGINYEKGATTKNQDAGFKYMG